MSTIRFNDYPNFKPNLTPEQIFTLGSFGGTYWRPIHSAVTGKDYKDVHKKYNWNIPEEYLSSSTCNKSLNRYKVRSGQSLSTWEQNGWIKAQDPYGWVQWYCEFYYGRRSPDDARQIKRWEAFAGPKGRFRNALINQIKRKGKSYDDETVSPKRRQALQQWAYQLTKEDF